MASPPAPYMPGEMFRRYQQNAANRTTSNERGEQDAIEEVNAESVTTDAASESRKRKSCSSSKVGAKAKKQKKWSWSPELVEELLHYIKEYKTQCEFNGIDFETDLQSMYTEIRRCMATDNPTAFGPESVSGQEKDLKDMGKEEYDAYRKKNEEEKRCIRKGYERIKEKVKNVRQDFRAAVNKGTRSGSGKIVQENYDLLTDIWGGSPATTSLQFGIDGTPPEEEGEIVVENFTEDSPVPSVSEDEDTSNTRNNPTGSDSTGSNTSRASVKVSSIAKLVDNKRKHMEKGLSQAQRDHMLMQQGKEEVVLKKQMLDAFERSNQTLDNSISKMTGCLTSLGEGIASGMQMVAMALAGGMPPQAQQPQHPHAPYPPPFNPNMYQYHPQVIANQESQTSNPHVLNRTGQFEPSCDGQLGNDSVRDSQYQY